MKVFRITTEVKSIKTIQYIVEANSKEEAELKIIEGEQRGEGEEINEHIEWGTEILTKTKFIEEIEE
jgi:hypothetical protein